MDRAFEKAGADDPKVVVKAVMAALLEKRTKPRVVVGNRRRHADGKGPNGVAVIGWETLDQHLRLFVSEFMRTCRYDRR
jgi:hypothetical protein